MISGLNPALLRTSTLGVRLRGRPVGVINRLAGDRHLFSFDPDYVDDPARPTLSLSFKGRAGGLVTTVRPVGRRLPPFFSNLLPEGPLRTCLARQAGVKPDREFFLLAALGADLPGAVTATPLDAGDRAAGLPEGEERIDGERPLRFSLAGVQLKFSAILEAHGSLTIPAGGMGGAWIVKLPSARFPAVAENEYVMLALARAVGIRVPANRLVTIRDIDGLPEEARQLDGNALAVERFDRAPGGQRLHMEDFAQVFGLFPEDKYDRRSYGDIAAVLGAETGEEGVDEFVRRLVFSVLIGNGDMHLKNWSILYAEERTPVLSPAYDLVATRPYIREDRLALTFGGERSLSGVSRDQIRRFSDTARLSAGSVGRMVIATAERTVEAWRTLVQKDILPTDMRRLVNDHIHAAAARTGAAR